MPATAYFARFTPSTIESRRTKAGAAQLKSRGIIENKNGPVVRTVVAYGRLHDEIMPHLEAGRPVLLKGYYERVENADGSRGGEFFKPFAVIKVYDRPVAAVANDNVELSVAANDTGRSVEGHDRKAHGRWQMCGKGRTERRWVLVRKSQVNGGRKEA